MDEFDEFDELFYPNQLKRNNQIYIDIENFEQFEFTHCLTYEFARRNTKVCELLNFLNFLFFFYNQRIYPEKDFDNNEFNKLKTYCKKILHDFNKIDSYTKIMNLEYKDIQFICNLVVETLIEELYEKYYVIYKNYLGFSDTIYNKNRFIERDKDLTKLSQEKILDKNCVNVVNNNPFYNSYQEADVNKKTFIFNTIYPNFKTAMRDFSDTKVTLNLSLPEKDLLSFISIIKKDYDDKDSSIKHIYELLGEEFHIEFEELKNLTKKEWADYFFIYDYIKETEDKNITTIYQKLQEIFTFMYGYKIEKTSEEIKNDKRKRDNSKFKIISSEKYNKLDSTIKKSVKPNISIDTLKNRYKFMENLIENLKYKFLINKYTKIEEDL